MQNIMCFLKPLASPKRKKKKKEKETVKYNVLIILKSLKGLLTIMAFIFFCRYLPPEIGCLNNLEDLDLSFNKMKTLPSEISYLSALISLKVTNNKLVELPSSLSSLQRLETLDLSNNRLTSLGSLELSSMHQLQTLNLQVFNTETFWFLIQISILLCLFSSFPLTRWSSFRWLHVWWLATIF